MSTSSELNPRIRWRIAEGKGFGKVRQAKIRVKEAPVPLGYWHDLQEEKEEESDQDDEDDEDGNYDEI